MNIHQISKISLTPEVVDGIVFWTKNPLPMLARLSEIKDYMYYFQFTITPYGKDVEPHVPIKSSKVLTSFKRLSDMIGADRIVWRYDPILINERYSLDYHIRAFRKIAEELHEYTRKVTISFIDEDYRGVKNNIKKLALHDFPATSQTQISASLAEIAQSYGLKIDTCAEKVELRHFGIEHARCIDDRIFSQLLGCHLNVKKDKTQRLECGCVESIDVGMYNTCPNCCRYCYANYSQNIVAKNFANHNPLSPLISGELRSDDKITLREVKSCKERQLNFESLKTIPPSQSN